MNVAWVIVKQEKPQLSYFQAPANKNPLTIPFIAQKTYMRIPLSITVKGGEKVCNPPLFVSEDKFNRNENKYQHHTHNYYIDKH